MSTINQLSAVDSLNAGDNVPVYSAAQGDARRFSLTTLVSFLSTAFTSFTVSSYIKTTPVTFGDLPSAASAGAGARAFVTDGSTATFNATIAGGGANVVPVFSDGTNWKVG
jgi:hypothetical protein